MLDELNVASGVGGYLVFFTPLAKRAVVKKIRLLHSPPDRPQWEAGWGYVVVLSQAFFCSHSFQATASIPHRMQSPAAVRLGSRLAAL